MAWGSAAEAVGHKVEHFVFNSHAQVSNKSAIVLSEEDLSIADSYLIRANKTLNRKFPTRSHKTNSLLRRNFYQIKDSDSVYAVTTIKDGKVQGGTAWAVQMYIDLRKERNLPINCFIFDMDSKSWVTYKNDSWVDMDQPVPTPSGVWAGIGSRKLTTEGINAICDALEQS